MLTVYKASAGSGKTFTLAFEYIKTLLGIRLHDNGTYRLNSDKYAPGGHRFARRHAGILAITFTNAATEEMKSRIIRQLSLLSDTATMDRTPYADMLCSPENFGCTREELCEASRTALSELLYDYGSFNVSTIDSFFQTVLRTFSREIDHQGDYELSLERKDMLSQAISLMLDELNDKGKKHAPRLYEWIQNYVMEHVASGSSYNFFNRDGDILRKLAKNMDSSMDETFIENVDALEQYLENPTRIKNFRKALQDLADNAFAQVQKAANALLKYRDDNNLPADYLSKLGKRIDYVFDRSISISKKYDTEIFRNGGSNDLSSFLKKAYVRLTPDPELALSLFNDFVHWMPICDKRHAMYQKLLESLGSLEFIGYTRSILNRMLQENNMMLIADTNELLSRIIKDAEMPFIYERIGTQLNNLLIDEFQDTSRMQWKNLKPLVGNSLASGNDNLIIGDVKQSIYRFRNSDSELLGSVVQAQDFPQYVRERGNAPRDNTNHRSAGDIVRFNNEIFAAMAENLGVKHYDEVRQATTAKLDKLQAHIKLHFHDDANGMQALVFEEMAQDILRQHSNGYAWRDIMILARKAKEATAIVQFLTQVHPEIRVLSSEALLLCNSPAIRSIISALKLIARSYEGKKSTRGDDAPLYASNGDIVMMITRYNYFSAKGYDNITALNMALEESDETSSHLQSEVDIIRAKNPANLVALIEAIVALRLSQEQRTDEYAYIAALQDLAMKHLESSNPSLSAFLDEYNRNQQKWAILAPSSLDAVVVMTVHKSKGLERACVHIPFGSWELTHGSKELWVHLNNFEGIDPAIVPPILNVNISGKSPFTDASVSPIAADIERNDMAEKMDNLNIAYVAFTRAARELIVHSEKSKEGHVGFALYNAFTNLLDSGTLPFTKVTNRESSDDDISPIDEYFVLGDYTQPEQRSEDNDSIVDNGGEYRVTFRDDTRELVSIDDILTADDDLGDEEKKEIVDEHKPFLGTPEMLEASRRGTNMHNILAAMRTLDDFEASLQRICARMGVEEKEKEEYRSRLTHAFELGGAQVADWFAQDNIVYPERSFYKPETGETFRPDRIIIRPNGKTVIIDYKFTTEARAGHRRQVAVYRDLLASMGRADVDVFIWYPLLDKIVKL